MSNRYNKFNITVITAPFNTVATEQLLTNLIQTLEPLSNKIIAITGNFPEYSNKRVRIIKVKGWQTKGKFLPFKMLTHVLADLQISANLLGVFRDIDIVAFHIGARAYPLSVLISKLLRKKILAFSFSSASKLAQIYKGQRTLYLASILEKFTFLLADQIAVESECVIEFSNLQKYRNKIVVCGVQHVDVKFFIKKRLKDKRNLIGYIGRLSPEKGITNFVKAIPLILEENGDLEFLIGGNGPLLDKITNELKNNGSYDKVELTGWIPHDELPNYLNELKLIIAPSYSEGGIPTIIQEAMACGTIVLVTPIAGIDIIKDAENGFVLEDNLPECIAKKVIRVLEYPDLEKIINSAIREVKEQFSYEKKVERYSDMLYKVLNKTTKTNK